MLRGSPAQMLHIFYIYLIIKILCNICAGDPRNICVKFYVAQKISKTQLNGLSPKKTKTLIVHSSSFIVHRSPL